MEHTYITKELIKEWQREIENYSGFECINLRDLKDSATLTEQQKARRLDALWFEGFANDLQNLI